MRSSMTNNIKNVNCHFVSCTNGNHETHDDVIDGNISHVTGSLCGELIDHL